MPDFPTEWIREQFPALNDGEEFVFFDNGAGAQVPQVVLDAVRDHLISRNVQRGGRYRRSIEVDAAIQRARENVALFVNACEPNEIAFGMNATSFIRIVSLALAESLSTRNEIVVSDLDHEANVATWLALERSGARIRWWHMREDGTLNVEDLEPLLNSKTRLVACALASNALGSVVDVKGAAARAHAAGAELFVDAVHYAPHGPIDVQDLDCDYMVCSGYKIFAPHMGFLWGKKAALDALPTFREDFIPDKVPFKIEVGTFVYENVAGMDAAITYLESVGRKISADASHLTKRDALKVAMEGIRTYEEILCECMLTTLSAVAGAHIYGIRDLGSMRARVPTLCFNVAGIPPMSVTTVLSEKNIGVRDGNMYSPRLLRRLGLAAETGAVRASLVHYNTLNEIERFAKAMRELVSTAS
jgi:cysteine desulfurase family protein (TIGR01976 family)